MEVHVLQFFVFGSDRSVGRDRLARGTEFCAWLNWGRNKELLSHGRQLSDDTWMYRRSNVLAHTQGKVVKFHPLSPACLRLPWNLICGSSRKHHHHIPFLVTIRRWNRHITCTRMLISAHISVAQKWGIFEQRSPRRRYKFYVQYAFSVSYISRNVWDIYSRPAVWNSVLFEINTVLRISSFILLLLLLLLYVLFCSECFRHILSLAYCVRYEFFSCISSTRIPSPNYQDTKITTLLIGQINWLEPWHHYTGGVFLFSVRYFHKSLLWQIASVRLSDEISMAPSIYCS